MSATTASSATIVIPDPNTGIAAFVVEAVPTTGSGAKKVQQTFNVKAATSQLTLTKLRGNTQYTVRVKACATADGSTCGALSSGVTAKTRIGSESKATI